MSIRIASSQFQATMSRSLLDNQSAIASLTSRIASGNALQVPSDDPVTSVRLSRLTNEEVIIDQYRDNISNTNNRLSSSETYLQSIANDLTQAHDQLVWAADASNSGQDLQSMASTMTSLRDSIFYSANEKDQEGNYVFSGTLTGTPAISYDPNAPIGSRYTYTGNTGDQEVLVGNGITQTANANVSGLEAVLNQLDVTADAMSQPGVSASTPALHDAVTANMDGASAALDLVAGKIAVIGGSQNIMNTLDGNHANVSQSNQAALLTLGSLDMGQAAVQLSGYNTALQASYKAFAKVSGLSLFNTI